MGKEAQTQRLALRREKRPKEEGRVRGGGRAPGNGDERRQPAAERRERAPARRELRGTGEPGTRSADFPAKCQLR